MVAATKAVPNAKLAVLFVCMGNICRSPTAEAVIRAKVAEAGLADLVEVGSAGTHAYHVGRPIGFEHVLDLIEAASDGLLAEVRARLEDRLSGGEGKSPTGCQRHLTITP